MQRRPKIVSSITTMDTAYLTVVANKIYIVDQEALAREILEMCRENAFDDIKLTTEDKAYPHTLYISVYQNESQLNEGKELLSIKYVPAEESMKVL